MYVLRRSALTVGTILVSLVIFGFIWDWALTARHVSPYVSSTPSQVWRYLFQVPVASQNRHTILSLLATTLEHAALGFAVGMVISVIIAVVFTLVPAVRAMFLPIAMLLRTVPLMAMAPIIYIVFGRGLLTAALVGTIVVFFPILVNLSVGFESATPQTRDVVHVAGGSDWTILRKVAFPSALPYFMASVRIAVPLAITGAMLYEWLFTYSGMGGQIAYAAANADYPEEWAIVAVVTIVAVLLYAIATIVEAAVLAAWGHERS